MRIIGGHDYYDSAMAYGQDDLVFVRKPQTFELKSCPLIPRYELPLVSDNTKTWMYKQDNVMIYRGVRYDVRPVTIYFAGKRYGGVGFHSDRDYVDRYFWDFNRFKEFVESREHFIKKVTSDYWLDRSHFKNVNEWFETRDITKEQYEWLIANRITIALYDDGWGREDKHWVCNSGEAKKNLKEYGFASVMDPYAAFQEISMWVGGILPRDGSPMVEITDPKIKAHKHGFDEWSFRKKKAV